MKYIPIVGPLLAAALLVTGCQDEQKTQTQTQQAKAEPAKIEINAAALREESWPGEPTDEVDMDENLARKNFMVVLDMSGSMAENRCAGTFPDKATAAKDVLHRWVQNIPEDANVGLVVFDERGTDVRVPLGLDNRNDFRSAVDSAIANGGTPLRSSIELAYNELVLQGYRQRGYGEYKIVTITDGEHSSGQNPTSIVNMIANNPSNPVELYTMGFCINDSALNSPGKTFYQSASDPAALEQGLNEVLAETSNINAQETFFDAQ